MATGKQLEALGNVAGRRPDHEFFICSSSVGDCDPADLYLQDLTHEAFWHVKPSGLVVEGWDASFTARGPVSATSENHEERT